MIEKLKLQIQIIKIKIQILLLQKKLTVPNLPEPKYLVIHHGGGNMTFEQVDIYHRRKWGFKSSLGFYAGYHYFIEDGKVYQARRDNEEAAHCVEKGNPHYWNKNSIGIGVKGNTELSDITSEDKIALEGLVVRLMGKYSIGKSHLLGHRDISATLCPGKYLYEWLTNFKGRL